MEPARRPHPHRRRLPRQRRCPRLDRPVRRGGVRRRATRAARPAARPADATGGPRPRGRADADPHLPRTGSSPAPSRSGWSSCSSARGCSPATTATSPSPTRPWPGNGPACAGGSTTTWRASGSCTTSPAPRTPGTRWADPDSELYRGVRLARVAGVAHRVGVRARAGRAVLPRRVRPLALGRGAHGSRADARPGPDEPTPPGRADRGRAAPGPRHGRRRHRRRPVRSRERQRRAGGQDAAQAEQSAISALARGAAARGTASGDLDTALLLAAAGVVPRRVARDGRQPAAGDQPEPCPDPLHPAGGPSETMALDVHPDGRTAAALRHRPLPQPRRPAHRCRARPTTDRHDPVRVRHTAGPPGQPRRSA